MRKDWEIAQRLREGGCFAQYSAWNFCGWVWWLEGRQQWACQIDVCKSHHEPLVADTLEEIMKQACARHGED
jgi:hypothetical protein